MRGLVIRKKIIKILILMTILIVISSLIIQYYCYAKESKMSMKKEIEFYKKIAYSEQEWIKSIQLSNGAIPLTESKSTTFNVIPYFSTIAAISLLKDVNHEEYNEHVKQYMTWHFNHLNTKEEDIYNGQGTIYDYKIIVKDGIVVEEKSKGKYDSADSYAALYIILLNQYYEISKDYEYLIENSECVYDIIKVMLNCIDYDGLSIVKHEYKIKYLMDNTEVNYAIKEAIKLLENVYIKNLLSYTDEYKEAISLKEELKKVIIKNKDSLQSKLWNRKEKRYEIGIDIKNKVIKFHGWNKFYPDAVAQLYPIIYEVADLKDKNIVNLYRKFCEKYKWEELEHYENNDSDFYWCSIVYAGAVMQDEVKVKGFMECYKEKVMINRKYPLHVAEAAWVIKACDFMVKYYEKKMRFIDPLRIIEI